MQKEKPNKTVLAGHKHELLQKIVTANDIRQALKKDEFMLYYQPQINSRSGCLTGMEALLRWKHPERGFISPKQFIAIAEETGQIIEIGDWALRAACRQRKIWNNMGLIQIPLAVNISICQLENHHIIETITEILQETGLDSKWLELEIIRRTWPALISAGRSCGRNRPSLAGSALPAVKRWPTPIRPSFCRSSATSCHTSPPPAFSTRC